MSDSLLFLLGVVGSPEDQPRNHRPAVVRCLEDELAPVRDLRPRCPECRISILAVGRTACNVCERERHNRMRCRRRNEDNRSNERIWEQLQRNGGFIPATNANRHHLERLVLQGHLRWMTHQEQQQADLMKADAVAVPANREKTGGPGSLDDRGRAAARGVQRFDAVAAPGGDK